MIKVPKELIIDKIKEKSGLNDQQIKSKVKDKLDQLSGLISEDGALHIIANELGVKILDDSKLQIKNVLSGMRSVNITAKIVKLYETREFAKGNMKGKVTNLLIGDDTGVIRLVAWNDKADLIKSLNEGDVIKIEDAYSRENMGKAEIHLGDKAKVTKTEEKMEIRPKTAERKSIKDLKETDDNVDIMGTILQVFDPRFFPIDPETGKRVSEKEDGFYFNDKKIATPDHSYVTNIILDDGTENIRVVLWKSQTQRLFGMSHDEMMSNKDMGFEQVKNDLLGKIVKFTGRVNKNQMFDRMEFIVQLVEPNPNPEDEIKRLQAENTPSEAKTESRPEPKAELKPEPKSKAKEDKPKAEKPKADKPKAKEEKPAAIDDDDEISLEDIESIDDLDI
ncbi:MAG: OB-fold nucleic acid binding domain-containing protein [Candidatus Woesearchaeota archaeon]|nr:OB-fold nucleic acid binding domain-containing protein [Candidatus Woesearchaeota archaeon]